MRGVASEDSRVRCGRIGMPRVIGLFGAIFGEMAGVEDLAGGMEFCNENEFTVDVDDRDEEDPAWMVDIVLRSTRCLP